MSYALGVDLGTAFTAAAVGRNGNVEMVRLGVRAPETPTVVFVGTDGEVLIGEAAERRAFTEPERVAREFKRRVGDPVPITIAGSPWSAEQLLARVLEWVIATATEQQGGPPSSVVVTHPANWGEFKLDVLREACRLAGVSAPKLISEPVAAAVAYAAEERADIGAVIAVYDLGGGTFDAAVLRKDAGGFALLGTPEGIERLGGVDFDEAVLRHVLAASGVDVAQLDADEPDVMTAMARLRADCVAAKEALSFDTRVSVPLYLPKLRHEVTLTRPEFEAMVRPPLAETVRSLRRTLQSAGVEAEQLRAVLLVGGSSRIPLVAQLIAEELGRPVAVDVHPKHPVALGAARSASIADAPVPSGVLPPPAEVAEPFRPVAVPSSRRRVLLGLALGVLVIAAIVVVALTRGGGGPAPAASTTSTLTTAPPTTVASTTGTSAAAPSTVPTAAELATAIPEGTWTLKPLTITSCNGVNPCAVGSSVGSFPMTIVCPATGCRMSFASSSTAPLTTDGTTWTGVGAPAPPGLSLNCKTGKADSFVSTQFTVDKATFRADGFHAAAIHGLLTVDANAQNGCNAAKIAYTYSSSGP